MRLQTLLWCAYMATGNILDTLVSDLWGKIWGCLTIRGHLTIRRHSCQDLITCQWQQKTLGMILQQILSQTDDVIWARHWTHLMFIFYISWLRNQWEMVTFFGDSEIQRWTSIQNYSTHKPCPQTNSIHHVLALYTRSCSLTSTPTLTSFPKRLRACYYHGISECKGGSFGL